MILNQLNNFFYFNDLNYFILFLQKNVLIQSPEIVSQRLREEMRMELKEEPDDRLQMQYRFQFPI
jgi:hypothetical protein